MFSLLVFMECSGENKRQELVFLTIQWAVELGGGGFLGLSYDKVVFRLLILNFLTLRIVTF